MRIKRFPCRASTYSSKGGHNYAVLTAEEVDFRITERVSTREIEEEEPAGMLCFSFRDDDIRYHVPKELDFVAFQGEKDRLILFR